MAFALGSGLAAMRIRGIALLHCNMELCDVRRKGKIPFFSGYSLEADKGAGISSPKPRALRRTTGG